MSAGLAKASDFYSIRCSFAKLEALDGAIDLAFGGSRGVPPTDPLREPQVLTPSLHPPKGGLSTRAGQARLAHDLASIELQATELALRTLIEFPDAPASFRDELAELVRSEGDHFRLCLETLDSLGFRFGDWPVHLALWKAVSPKDTLLDRVVIVHRYLEGAGLDASETILRRLSSSDGVSVRETVKTIAREEVAHVEFGSRWMREICRSHGLDPEYEFASRLERLAREIPRREPLSRETRVRAGFTERELEALERARGPKNGPYAKAVPAEDALERDRPG